MKTVQSIKDYESQDDFYLKGIEIIKKAKEVREEINRYDIRISSARYRLERDPKDEQWAKALEDDTKEQAHFKEEAALLESELYYLNQTMKDEDYRNLLDRYGCMLADTTPIEHIGSGYLDANQIAKSAEETKKAMDELLQARQAAPSAEALAIIDAELLWFNEDMHKHEWGAEVVDFVGPKPERRAR